MILSKNIKKNENENVIIFFMKNFQKINEHFLKMYATI